MTTKKIVIATSIPVARRFISRSWRLRSSSRLTGGVADPDPGTVLTPEVAGPAEEDPSRVRRSTISIGSDDPDVLIPATDGSYAAAPPGVNVTGRCLMPLMKPERRRDGSPDVSM